MKFDELLAIIQETAIKNNLSQPFITGGAVRDRVRDEAKEVNDIDLTTSGADSLSLAFACAKVLPYNFLQLYDDGHVSIKIGGLKIDFSSHFIIPGIEDELIRLNIKDYSPLTKEMYSRDFTINTLLQDLSFEKVFDITGQAVRDIRAGIVRCPINPELTIKYDPKRILRALKFALRFNYTIDGDLIKAIKKYKHLLKNESPDYVKDKANELIMLNSKQAIKMMVELGLLTEIPMTKLISNALIENKLLYYAFEDKHTNNDK